MALEATKLASTSNTDIGDMSGPGEGRAAPGLPNSGFQKYWDSEICFVQFTFDTESTGLIIDRPVWEPRNWPARLEIWIDPSDYLALNGPGLLFLRIFVAALQCAPPRSRHLSLSKQQGVSSASQLPWEWMKTKFTVKAKNFHGSIFQRWHFSFFSIKDLVDNSIRWRCLWWNMINEARLMG